MPLIECVPNVSEGQREDVVDQLAAQVGGVPGVRLLDRTSDPSHNRSVFTVAGEYEPLKRAILRLAACAVAAIDLRQQRGQHPRIGALDVVPFIPLGDTPMTACVGLARDVGRALADQLEVPVYLYEQAATSPAHQRLEDIRRGQFEGLSAKMQQAEWAPDFGPAAPHPTAGATAVGARRALIAYNVNLASDNLDLARRIAAVVRASNGGLPCVKALGLALPHRGLVQVSMNLTDFEQTSMQTAFDQVAAAARSAGVEVLESEIVGLIPAAALRGTTPERLRLRNFSDEKILERRLDAIG